jgi:hypothetical protein
MEMLTYGGDILPSFFKLLFFSVLGFTDLRPSCWLEGFFFFFL